jgi:hypothetical protein
MNIFHNKTYILFIPLFFLMFCSSVENKKTIIIKKGFVGMVGYGTLMSLRSIEQTLGYKYQDSIYQVHLMGYVRAWSYFRPINDPQNASKDRTKYYGFIVQDKDTLAFDGILYFITEKELSEFDRREFGYHRVDVTNKIEEYNFTGGKVYVYQHFLQPRDKSMADNKYILIKDYMDFITSICDSMGKNYRTEFDKSTVAPTSQIVPYEKIVWKKG